MLNPPDRPDEPTEREQSLIEADDRAQEKADQLTEAGAVERNNRRWLIAATKVMELIGYTDPMIDEGVRDARDETVKAACECAQRILKRVAPLDRSQ